MNFEQKDEDGHLTSGLLFRPQGVDHKAPINIAIHGGAWHKGAADYFAHWGRRSPNKVINFSPLNIGSRRTVPTAIRRRLKMSKQPCTPFGGNLSDWGSIQFASPLWAHQLGCVWLHLWR